MNRSRRTAGTSLVEILVVIVVFLIGILAIVQIFPGGFRLLGLTKSQSQATGLARTTIDRLKNRAEQLPDRIVPVRYVRAGGELVAIVDSTRRTNDLGPTADGLDQNGNLFLLGDNLGPWRRASGGNMVSRIVGEGTIIPAPRPVDSTISGNLYYGGLMTLQFGPTLFNPEVAGNSPDNDVIFNVYANDLSLALGAPLADAGPFRPYQFFCDQPETAAATLHIPRLPGDVRYRLAAMVYVRDGFGATRTIELLDYIVPVNAGPANTFAQVPLAVIVNALPTPPLAPGESFAGVEFDSIQLAPVYDRVPKANAFDLGNPYQYKLIDDLNPGVTNANMGVLLFNPSGYEYYIPTADGRRTPLTARVNYNVYDWGILRDEFRIPDGLNASVKLTLNGLKVKGNADTDGRTYQGLGFVVPNGTGGTQELDFVVQDTETGGIYAYNPAALGDPVQTAYRVDRSSGSIIFLDRNTATAELEVTLYNPVTWTPIEISDARGRSVRVMYQSAQEFQVQVMKAASRYFGVAGIPGSGQCALGAIGDPAQETKLYFSNSDLGRSVSINEAFVRWDVNGDGAWDEVRKVSVSGTIKAPTALDPIQLPSLDLTDVYGTTPGGTPWAVSWSPTDETGKSPGYIVRGVRGASVAVRVLWNPQKFNLGSDSAANMTAFDRWGSNWRKSTTETYLQKGGTQ